MEYVDIEVNLGSKLAGQIKAMKKDEIINCFVVSILKERVAQEDINNLELEVSELKKNNERLELNLTKAELYVEQGRAMIKSVTDKWYDYE